MTNKFIDKIKGFKNIVIFRHQKPDGDCIFCALALYEFLKLNYSDKRIKLAGNDEYDLVFKKHNISDSFIKDSLAIVVDTATKDRIDDDRFVNAKYIIKIDHHPSNNNNYGDLNIIDEKASSACQIIANMFLSKQFKDYKFNNKIYEYLYCGIVTDTINFKTSNTTSNTLEIASKLIDKGNLKPSNLVEFLFDTSLSNYKKRTLLRNKLCVKNNFGYIKLNSNDLKSIGFTASEAKNCIDEIGTIKELNIWAFAVENDGLWDCSLRAKRAYIINKFAMKYNGGGHPNACAVKRLKASELNNLFKELIEFSTK